MRDDKNMKARKTPRRRTFIVSVVVIYTMLVVFGCYVYAYFSANATFPNVFNVSEHNMVLIENFDPTNWPDVTTKKISLRNDAPLDTGVPVYVRIQFAESWYSYDMQNNSRVDLSLTLKNAEAKQQNVVIKTWNADAGLYTQSGEFNEAKWVKGSDGWFYYRAVVKPGESVDILETVKLDTELLQAVFADADNGEFLANQYKEGNYTLTFLYEAALSEHADRGYAYTELDDWEYAPTVADGVVSWNTK